MSSAAIDFVSLGVDPHERLDILFDELAELTGQRNAIDGRVVQIVAEIDHDGLWGATGVRSVEALVAWKTGVSPTNAKAIATIAHRIEEFPHCVRDLREGRLSLDQVGVIAQRAADGSDEHYAELAACATVKQLRKAITLAPKPKPEPEPQPDADPPTEPPPAPEPRSISKTSDGESTTWRITLPRVEAAKFAAALASHQDAVVAQWRRDHTDSDGDWENGVGDAVGEQAASFPDAVDGFMSLVEAGWDTDVARRPHGQHTTVVVHLDVEHRDAALHLGPCLSESDRRELMCDADCEVWFERHGQVVGSARATRQIGRRLRRALEHRDRCCVVPGCGATRGLHAHHIVHWEDGGLTELFNLVLVCPFHHRLHHRGGITITGPADHLVVTDRAGRRLVAGSLARPPTTPPPAVAPYKGPTGERADWWWYQPFEPQPPAITEHRGSLN